MIERVQANLARAYDGNWSLPRAKNVRLNIPNERFWAGASDDMRTFLKLLIVIGMLVFLFGPCMRISNEGFGGPPGSLAVSRMWTQISYVLMPVGAAVAIVSAVCLWRHDSRR